MYRLDAVRTLYIMYEACTINCSREGITTSGVDNNIRWERARAPSTGWRRICMSLVLLNGLENYTYIQTEKAYSARGEQTTISRKRLRATVNADDVK